jgi:hypothetical protein
MEEIIKLTSKEYTSSPKFKDQIERGDYVLLVGSTEVSRENWDKVVTPWWTVTLTHQHSRRPPPPVNYGRNYNQNPFSPYPGPSNYPRPGNYLDYDDYSRGGGGSQAGSEDLGESDAGSQTEYHDQIKYRIDYHIRDEMMGPRGAFSHSYIEQDPITIIDQFTEKHSSNAALEEIQAITIASETSLRQRKISKGKLKLGVNDSAGAKKLRILSPLLLNVIRSIVQYTSTMEQQTDPFIDGVFTYPFKDLFLHKQELLDYKESTDGPKANHTAQYNEDCDEHIDILIKYLNNEPGIQITSLEAKWASVIPTTTFAGIWLLMKPGTDVYVEDHGELNAYVIDSVNGGPHYSLEEHWSSLAWQYTIDVWKLVYDGSVIRRGLRTIHIPVFSGEREITSLPVFPTRFHDSSDNGARQTALINRGKNFFSYCKKPKFLEYTGRGLKPGWKKVSSSYIPRVFE